MVDRGTGVILSSGKLDQADIIQLPGYDRNQLIDKKVQEYYHGVPDQPDLSAAPSAVRQYPAIAGLLSLPCSSSERGVCYGLPLHTPLRRLQS